MIATKFGTIDYLDSPDTLAVRHNLRVDAMRQLDAAASNQERAFHAMDAHTLALLLDIARRQERNARNLLEDARIAK